MKKFQFSKYCSPAQLYLVLGMIGIIGAFFNNYSIETLLTNALFLVVWAWVLNWLCSKGFKAISWILVLLPFIMALFTYFLTKDVVVREGYSGCNPDPGPNRDKCLAFEAQAAANKAAAEAAAAKKQQEAVAKAVAGPWAAAKKQQEDALAAAKKQQEDALAAAAARNN